MDLRKLNAVCFTICIVCIVGCVLIGMGLIWMPENNEFYRSIAWKGFLSLALLSFGTALTAAVSRTFALPPQTPVADTKSPP